MSHPFDRLTNVPKKKHSLYNRWLKIIQFTTNPSNKHYYLYGEKGITVCSEWTKSFNNFLLWSAKNGYKKDLVLCRKNKNEGFNPDNCMWAEHAYSTEPYTA